MDLELATVDDMIEELKRRGAHFVFVGISPTNLREKTMTYAFQGASPHEVVWLMRQLKIHASRGPTTNDPENET